MINLALDKPATQSSTCRYSAHRDPATDARGANNGVLDCDTGFHTDAEAAPWWQVDLQEPCLVSHVVLHNRRIAASRLRDFSILFSSDGELWAVAFAVAGNVATPEDLPYIVEWPSPRSARFVRLRLDAHDYLHFREMQVFGADDAGQRDAGPATLGHVVEIGGFRIGDGGGSYARPIVDALASGDYERQERDIASRILQPGDRVIEAGTAIGVVSMTAAAIVGAGAVMTFDANPDIVRDARRNFRLNGFRAIASRFGLLKNRTAFVPGEQMEFHLSRDFWASRLKADSRDADIERTILAPVHCLEAEVSGHGANVLVCDIEGGEASLLAGSDLSGIDKIILETHYWSAGRPATDAMVRDLVVRGFSIDLELSERQVLFLYR